MEQAPLVDATHLQPQTTSGSVAEAGVAAIILAAGKSTRMRSRTPKTLHPVCGKPLLSHILDALSCAEVARRVVVVGFQADMVQASLDARYGAGTVEYALQAEQKGTGHAVQMTAPLLSDWPGTVLVLPGDAPLLTASILSELLQHHRNTKASATLLTAVLPGDAGSYGRVLRTENGQVSAIVEARDATPEQKAVREINTSVYAFEAGDLFHVLHSLQPNNAQGELYLTDVIGLLNQAGKRVEAHISPDPDVVLGVNTRVELAEIGGVLRRRLVKELMLAGVSIPDPSTTYVEADVTVGQDTTIYPGSHLLAGTVVGTDCVIGPNTYLSGVRVGNRTQIRFSVVEQCEVGDDCKIGPFAHLRPGSRLHDRVKIGNFVETKAATIHENVSAGHLTYLGDAEVGANTNIGAGTITCNYDGVQKHRTQIGSDAFVGSQSTLVAPVSIGDGAFIGAGSVITDDVAPDALALGRARQVAKEGWAKNRRLARQALPKVSPTVTASTAPPSRPAPEKDVQTL